MQFNPFDQSGDEQAIVAVFPDKLNEKLVVIQPKESHGSNPHIRLEEAQIDHREVAFLCQLL